MDTISSPTIEEINVMPAEFPYMNSIGSIPTILGRIKEAGAPPRFTHEFLRTSLGFTSSNDRSIISILRQLGFLTSDGAPTDRYHEFRGNFGGKALAAGLREGWSDLFLADQNAHTKTATQLQSLFKSVSGKSESVAKKMALTFKALTDQADWSASANSPAVAITDDDAPPPLDNTPREQLPSMTLHQDVHVHLPATSDVAVYRAIFRALKDELL
jgi:hypothetical protein